MEMNSVVYLHFVKLLMIDSTDSLMVPTYFLIGPVLIVDSLSAGIVVLKELRLNLMLTLDLD